MSENRELALRQGESVFEQGEYGSCIYKVLSGSLLVTAHSGEGDETLLTELRPGDWFGEMAIIEITQRSATIAAAEDGTRVAEIDASDLSGYLESHREDINGIARHLCRRLRELTEDHTAVCDALRDLGRLDTSADGLDAHFLTRVRRFARVWIKGHDAAARRNGLELQTAARDFDLAPAADGGGYRAGDVLFREGDEPSCMYYLERGKIGIYTGYGTKRQHLLTELTSETFLGELGLFEDARRTATAVVHTNDALIEPIRERDLAAIFERDPTLALSILQHLSSRLRGLTADYVEACRALAAATDRGDGTGLAAGAAE